MARTKKKTAAQKAETLPEVIESIKGFDLNFQCRDYQFKVGETYIHDGDVEVCARGFHGIGGNPLEVFDYYPPGQSRYASTTQGGKIARHNNDSKIASARITIHAELNLHDLIGRAVAWIMNAAGPAKTNHAEGDRSAASSTGDRSAASSTGYQSAASSTGYRSAASSTGDQSAASSTGDRSAASSTGDQSAASSTGYQSAASSTGDQSAASSTGDQSAASSTGDQSAASSTGDQSAASSTGDRSAASSTGYQSAATSSGKEGRTMGVKGNALFLVYRDPNTWDILHAWAGVVGQNGIKPNVWYSLDSDGQPIVVEN